jgi:hypothetical protein
VSLATQRSPDIWMEIQVYPYPDGDTIYTRLSRKPMAYPTFIDGRLDLTRGISDFERALSDWKGNPQAAVLTLQGNDSDAYIRELINILRDSAYRHAETSLFLLSSELRKSVTPPTPLWLHRGYLSRAPETAPRRTFKLSAVDSAGSTWFRLNPAQTLQTRFITRAVMEYAGIVGTPKDILNKPFPILVGEHNNNGRVDALGQPLGYGTIPAQYWGKQIFTTSGEVVTPGTRTPTVVPPPILTVTKSYADGPGDEEITLTYFVSAKMKDGTETTWSVGVPISGSRVRNPNFQGLNLTNFNALSAVAPPGWEAYYAENVETLRVMMASGLATAPTFYLDQISLWDGTTGTYNDGEIHNRDEYDTEKPGPLAPSPGTAVALLESPGNVSTVTTDTEWHVFGWMLGYGKMLSIFGPDLRPDAPPKSVQLDPNHPDLSTPVSANWMQGNPWVDLVTSQGTIRVSLFYAKGELAAKVLAGEVGFTLNSCGPDRNYDGTGVQITEAAEAYIFMMNEFVFKPQTAVDGLGWDGGVTPFALVEFSDGTTMLNTDLIKAFQAATVPLCASQDRGFQFNYYRDDAITVQQFEQDVNLTLFTYTGDLDNGQRALFFIDPGASLSGTLHIRKEIELGSQSLPPMQEADDQVETHIRYKCEYQPSTRTFVGEAQEIWNQDATKRYGRRDAAENFLELRCTRDAETANAAMQLRLFFNSSIPQYQQLPPLSLQGVHIQQGSVVRLTHDDGPGLLGYVNEAFFVVRKKYVNLNGNSPGVVITGRNIQRVFDVLQESGVFDVSTIMDFVMQ